MFESVVPFVKDRLQKHHELYSGACKAEYWEENLAFSLKQSEFGSDWKPDFNHKSGVDQTTDKGIRIGNKSGSLHLNYVEISGSRLTKHKTLQEKLDFINTKKEDYIFCLSTDKNEWLKGIRRYYFLILDSDILNYKEREWKETYETKGVNKGKITGWKCSNEVFHAKIVKSMSDQLWTRVNLDYCKEFYEITV